MVRKKSKTLTDAELRIMKMVWKLKQATVKEVTELLQKDGKIAYNTVQTMMRILEEKKYVQHVKQGRSFIYSPIVGQKSASSVALRNLLSSFFDDSPHSLMANLLEDEQLDEFELQRLKDAIEKAEKEENND